MEPKELYKDIPASGAVFAFGKKVPERFYIKNDSIISAACGEEHALVATSSGRLFAFGKNDSGQLGLGHKEPSVTKPTCVKRLRELNQKAVRVACGPTHSLVTTESGAVYGCGINTDGQLTGTEVDYADPVEIKHLAGRDIKDLAAGRSFSAVLTKQGEVFTWGSNEEGCLGCGAEVAESRDSLVQVRLPDKAISISAGAYHCACVLANGQVFTWGETEGGKLGCPGSESQAAQHLPQLAPLPPDEKSASSSPAKARTVACGLRHTLVLTDTGQVLACGSGESGQLGLGTSCGYTAAFMPVQALEGTAVAGISAGESHSACVSSEAGFLYTFGDALHGKLGPSSRLGGHSNQHRPFRVAALKPIRVRRAVCGNVLTLVLAVQRAPGDPAAAGDSDEADDPLDSLSARSPRPLKLAEQAALEATGGVGGEGGSGGLLRRRSSRSRQKYRELARSSGDGGGLLPPPMPNGMDNFELVRPAARDSPGAAKTSLESKPSVSKLPTVDNAKAEAISKFDELLKPLDADEHDGAESTTKKSVAANAATEPKIKRSQMRRPSEAQPISNPVSDNARPAEQPEDSEEPPAPAQADEQPAGHPNLIEDPATTEADRTAAAADAAAAAAAAPSAVAAEDPGGTQQPVRSGGCGKRSKGREAQPAAGGTPEGAEGGQEGQPQQQPQQHGDAVKSAGCGPRRQPKQTATAPVEAASPPSTLPEGDGAATAPEEAVVPATSGDAESAPMPEGAIGGAAGPAPNAKDDAQQEAGGNAGAVKGVGCGRSRRQKAAQPPPPPPDAANVEEAVVASDAKAAESAPTPQEPVASGAADPSGTSGAVKGVGCGRSRGQKKSPEASPPPPPQDAAAAEEAVVAAAAPTAESAPAGQEAEAPTAAAAAADASAPKAADSANSGGNSGAVKGVGCGRSRGKNPQEPGSQPTAASGTTGEGATGEGGLPSSSEAPQAEAATADSTKSKSCVLL